MKFTEHLQAHLTPEWRKQYIRYEDMKHMLYAKEHEYTEAGMSQAEQERYLINFDEEFFNFCEAELTKINTFFAEKLAEAIRKLASLKFELSIFIEASSALAAASRDASAKQKDPKNSLSPWNFSFSSNSSPTHPTTQPAGVKPSLTNGGTNIPNPITQTENSGMSWVRWVAPASLFGGGKKSTQKKAEDLKLAFSEYYLSLVLLQNYQQLNYTGFRKILKKHDKLFSTESGNNWRILNVDCAPFYTNQDINRFIQEVESLYTNSLVAGDRTKAMKRLRVPPLSEQKSLWTSFRLGLFLGFFIVLVTVIILASIYTNHRDDWRPAVRIFRGAFLVVLFTYLLGMNTYGWQSAGVNHVLIFEIDPRNHLTDQQILEIASILGVLWALAVIVYLFSDTLRVPALLSPLVLVAIYIMFLLNPTPTLYYRSRFWLLRILWRICNAPFYHVGFADFWLADQLNSLVTVFLDFEYLVCYYAVEVEWLPVRKHGVCFTNSYGVRPVIAMLPAWFRFFQCLRRYRDSKQAFPHLVNAGKYSTTFFVVLFSTLHTFQPKKSVSGDLTLYIWITAAVVSSLYAYAWDIKRDWGLFDKSAPPDARLLREQMVYSKKTYYYLAMVEDLILRFAWTLTVSVGKEELLEADILISILAPLEVFRRFFWNFFRLENEHLNNCGQFRAVRDISIAPIDKNDLALLEKMMDEEDGQINNRKPPSTQSQNHLRNLKSSNSLATASTGAGILNLHSSSTNNLTVPLLTTTSSLTPDLALQQNANTVGASASFPSPPKKHQRSGSTVSANGGNIINTHPASHHYLFSLNNPSKLAAKLSSKITGQFFTPAQTYIAPSANPSKRSFQSLNTGRTRRQSKVTAVQSEMQLAQKRQLQLQIENEKMADYTINPDYDPYVGIIIPGDRPQVEEGNIDLTDHSRDEFINQHIESVDPYTLVAEVPTYATADDQNYTNYPNVVDDPLAYYPNYNTNNSNTDKRSLQIRSPELNITRPIGYENGLPAYERAEYTDTVASDIFRQICSNEPPSKYGAFFGASSSNFDSGNTNLKVAYKKPKKVNINTTASPPKRNSLLNFSLIKMFHPSATVNHTIKSPKKPLPERSVRSKMSELGGHSLVGGPKQYNQKSSDRVPIINAEDDNQFPSYQHLKNISTEKKTNSVEIPIGNETRNAESIIRNSSISLEDNQNQSLLANVSPIHSAPNSPIIIRSNLENKGIKDSFCMQRI